MQRANRESPRPSWLFPLGAALLAASTVFALLLVLEHLSGLRLPGCREGGPCEQAANSFWGSVRVGGLRWPVADLGFAYFLAMLGSWIASRGALPRLLRHVARLGALVSLGFTALILGKSMLCPYCIGAHVGNFAFWITMESASRSSRASRREGGRPVAAMPPGPAAGRGAAVLDRKVAGFALLFLIVSAALGTWSGRQQAAIKARAEAERSEAARRMIDASREEPRPSHPAVADPSSTSASTLAPAAPERTRPGSSPASAPTETASATSALPTSPPSSPSPEGRFEGRYPWGPEVAPIRIVIFMGYQCPDCYVIEQQLTALMATHTDISLSVKHFPFCSDCNPNITHTSQPNGCWAARAAEAAGILWGTEGFWKMHRWLFEHRGSFQTVSALAPAFYHPGYDPDAFSKVMTGEETLRRVRADCAEAESLGLYFTPMIFINGVELKGWNAPNALTRTVEQVAATHPAARPAGSDHPPAALQKYVDDWRDQPLRTLPAEGQTWTLGPAGAAVRVVVWGDYEESGTLEVDRIVRSYLERGGANYTFRQYPFNHDCVAKVPDRRHPNACRSARAAEAAGLLGGNDAFWKMHDWLMKHGERFTDAELSAAAAAAGLDGAGLLAEMQKPESEARVDEDVQAADALPVLRIGVPPGLYAIPTIFVNGRYVPRWQMNEKSILEKILQAAASASQGG